MKKIFLFIGILFIALNIQVKASKVIIGEVGSIDVRDLEEEGSILLTKDIDLSIPSLYELSYYNKTSGLIYKKDLHIVSSENLINKYQFSKEIANITLNNDYRINDYLVYGNYIFIVGEIDFDHEIIQTEFTQSYAFIHCYYNNELIWKEEYNKHSEIKKIIKTKSGILCLVTIQNDGDYTDLGLIEYGFDGKVLRKKYYQANYYERGIGLIDDDNYYYMLFYTNSSKGNFVTPYPNNRIIGIAKIDQFTFDILDIKYIGNNLDNFIIDYCYDSQIKVIYLLTNFYGNDGKYQGNDGFTGNYLVSISNDFNKEDYIKLNSNNTYLGLCYSDRGVRVITKNIVYNGYLSFYKYSNDLHLVDFKQKFFGFEINGVTGIYPRNEREIVALRTYNDEIVSLYDVIDDIEYSFTNNIQFIKYLDEKIFLLERTNNFFKIYLNKTILKRINGINNFDNIPYYSFELWVDDMYQGGHPYEGYHQNFGHYQDKMIYKDEDIILIYNYNYFVRDEINIKNNEIYDKGIVLIFNGKGYLNDQEISSGYVINDVGFYNLKIYGENISKNINFKVSNLTVDEKEYVDYSLIEMENRIVRSNKNLLNFDFDKDIFPEKEFNPLAINTIIILIGIGLGFLIPINRRK